MTVPAARACGFKLPGAWHGCVLPAGHHVQRQGRQASGMVLLLCLMRHVARYWLETPPVLVWGHVSHFTFVTEWPSCHVLAWWALGSNSCACRGRRSWIR